MLADSTSTIHYDTLQLEKCDLAGRCGSERPPAADDGDTRRQATRRESCQSDRLSR